MALVAVSFLTLEAFAAPNFSEGKWEIKGEVKLEGMPFAMSSMPFNYSQCLTKKDMVPHKQEKKQECTKVSEKIAGNSVSWVMECKDSRGTVTRSTGKASYAGATFNAKIHNVSTDARGQKSESNMTMSGRRTGACK